MMTLHIWHIWDCAERHRHSPKLLTSFASMTVPTPTVSAMVGTFEISPSKNRALAIIVSFAKVFTRVLDTRLEPGSLKAMWPSGPIPDKIQWTQIWIMLRRVDDNCLLSALWPPDLQQTARSHRRLLSFPQMLHTLLAGLPHCRLRYVCSLLLCLCAWRSYSTWRSGSSQGDLLEALYKVVITIIQP